MILTKTSLVSAPNLIHNHPNLVNSPTPHPRPNHSKCASTSHMLFWLSPPCQPKSFWSFNCQPRHYLIPRAFSEIPQVGGRKWSTLSSVISQYPQFTSSLVLLILYCNCTFIFKTSFINFEPMEDRSLVFYLVCNRCLAYVCWMNKWHMNRHASLLDLGHEMWQ